MGVSKKKSDPLLSTDCLLMSSMRTRPDSLMHWRLGINCPRNLGRTWIRVLRPKLTALLTVTGFKFQTRATGLIRSRFLRMWKASFLDIFPRRSEHETNSLSLHGARRNPNSKLRPYRFPSRFHLTHLSFSFPPIATGEGRSERGNGEPQEDPRPGPIPRDSQEAGMWHWRFHRWEAPEAPGLRQLRAETPAPWDRRLPLHGPRRRLRRYREVPEHPAPGASRVCSLLFDGSLWELGHSLVRVLKLLTDFRSLGLIFAASV